MTNSSEATLVPQGHAGGLSSRGEPANLGDILERVLDRGLVIAGDIKVNLLDIELLTIKLRLLVVSVETARELGIDWWEHDPWLTGGRQDLAEENRQLREQVRALEEGDGASLEQGDGATEEPAPRRSKDSEERVSRRRGNNG